MFVVEIREGLKKTIDWFFEHGARWSWEDWVEGTIIYDMKV